MGLRAALGVCVALVACARAGISKTIAFAAGEAFEWCPGRSPWCTLGQQPVAKGNVACFRIPSLVEASPGHLVAVAEARLASCDDETDKMLAIKLSNDSGSTWGPLGFVHGTPTSRSWNPELAFDGSRVLLQFLVNRTNCLSRPGGCMAFQVASTDNGGTWTAPMSLEPFLGDRFANGVRPGPGRGIVLRHGPHAGRVLFSGSYSELNITGRSHSVAVDIVWFSDDGGSTFSLSDARFSAADETTMAQLPNGSVILNMRNAGASARKCRLAARSDDGGETWGPMVEVPDLVSPGCEGSLLASDDGSLLFSNPSSATERRNMTVKRSTDGGATWPTALVVEAGPAAYSCLARLADDASRVALLYERGPAAAQGPYGDLVLAHVPTAI